MRIQKVVLLLMYFNQTTSNKLLLFIKVYKHSTYETIKVELDKEKKNIYRIGLYKKNIYMKVEPQLNEGCELINNLVDKKINIVD